jgi:DNA-binding transcriptional ArsR family regulator
LASAGHWDKAGVIANRDAPKMTRRTGSGIALLADDTRRMIVALIALRPRHPTELSRELGLSLPAISRQLSLLTTAGLVQVARSRVDARGRVYTLDPREHGRIIAWLAGTDVGLEESILSRWARAAAAGTESD